MQESSVQVSSVKGEAQTWEAHSSALFSMNSELLDLLQATQDSSLEADSANPIPQTPSPSPRISPPRLVVGGSLFPRYAGAASARNPMTMKICEGVRLAAPPRSSHFPLGGYRLGLLRFGTLYCPFTKQFFSLSSMHWSCLRAAGFDVDISMYCGRSVRLLNPVQLYRMACELHNSTPVWKKETPGFPLHCPVAPDPPKPLPILQAKKFYHQQAWSNLLASTLGKLLESAATSDFHRFCQSISASVELESDPFTSRRIQFTHDWLLSMHSTTSASTEAPRNLPTGAMSEYTTISAAMAREQCGWRREVLQLRPKWIPTVEADRTSPLSDGSSLGEAAASSSPCVESWIRPFVHRPLLQLLPGLPSHTRAVQLFVQASHDGDVQVVCECVLGNLVRQARCHSHPPTIYTCPVHHCVDYSTVLDLVAFPVVDTGQHLDATPHHKLISERRLDTSTSVPLLSLGLPSSNTSVEDAKFFVDVRPPECVVVIENAHFFSRRAISRLLDQWTRNGAAWQIVMEGCCDPQQTASSDGASSHSISTFRQLLLGVEPITKSVRLRHGHPLGRVQVVLVGLSMSQVSSSSTPEGDADRWVEVAHASGEMTVELNSGPCQSRFFVEEPLSATLLRLAPMYARKMTGVARTEVRQEIVEAAIALLPNTLHLQQTHSRLLRSGKKEYSGSEGVPLHSLAGEALLSEACEQLLQLGDSADGCPKMDSSMEGTGRYPFLNTLRVRHALLNGHYMRVRRSLSSPSDPPRHGRAEPVNRQVLQVDFCDSRQEWMDRHEQQLGELARCAWAEQRCMWQGKHSTPSVQSDFREAYHPFLEPPLLLGQWTSTLLFCAPAVADVLPLRAILLDALRRQQPPDGWETDCVDIMHVDSVVFPSERRCRLFGVPARFADTSDFTMLAKAACEKALQRVLKAYAATQSLFSLWTYRLASSNEVARERLGDVVASLGEGSRLRILPASTTDFSAVTEWKSPLVPNTVEKRLFSLAMFQQPPLQVAVGSRVVLRSAQHLQRHDSRPGMSMTGAVRPSPETSQPIVVSRGTICTVVRLVAHNELQKQETGLMASAAQPTSAHRDYAQLYAEQQPQGTCRFPLLETMTTDGKMVRFILLPEPTIVGGYMSLHFYGLPLLHLPMHVLLSSTSERAGIHRRSRLNHGGETQASTRACVCSTAVFHPFSTHPDSLSAITFTEKDYLAAFDRLRKRTSQLESTDDPDDHTLYSFVEDVVFENDRPFAEGEVNARDETSAVFTSSALTELSLFPRMGVSYTQAHPLSTSSTEGE